MNINERAKQLCDAGECASMGEARRILIIKGEARFCIECAKPFIPDQAGQDSCSIACVRGRVRRLSLVKATERTKRLSNTFRSLSW
jgi:hypothetical protein